MDTNWGLFRQVKTALVKWCTSQIVANFVHTQAQYLQHIPDFRYTVSFTLDREASEAIDALKLQCLNSGVSVQHLQDAVAAQYTWLEEQLKEAHEILSLAWWSRCFWGTRPHTKQSFLWQLREVIGLSVKGDFMKKISYLQPLVHPRATLGSSSVHGGTFVESTDGLMTIAQEMQRLHDFLCDKIGAKAREDPHTALDMQRHLKFLHDLHKGAVFLRDETSSMVRLAMDLLESAGAEEQLRIMKSAMEGGQQPSSKLCSYIRHLKVIAQPGIYPINWGSSDGEFAEWKNISGVYSEEEINAAKRGIHELGGLTNLADIMDAMTLRIYRNNERSTDTYVSYAHELSQYQARLSQILRV